MCATPRAFIEDSAPQKITAKILNVNQWGQVSTFDITNYLKGIYF